MAIKSYKEVAKREKKFKKNKNYKGRKKSRMNDIDTLSYVPSSTDSNSSSGFLSNFFSSDSSSECSPDFDVNCD